MTARHRVFLDASVLVAAAGSPEGGSALVLDLCASGRARALVTQIVLREAERNIRAKLDEAALLRFYKLLGRLDPELMPLPSDKDLQAAAAAVAPKDAHVLAGARRGKATHLLTLDRKHFLTDKARAEADPIIICTPGELLRTVLEEESD